MFFVFYVNVKFILIEGYEVMKDEGVGGDYVFFSLNLDKFLFLVVSFFRNISFCY